jgi:hypothetical protein
MSGLVIARNRLFGTLLVRVLKILRYYTLCPKLRRPFDPFPVVIWRWRFWSTACKRALRHGVGCCGQILDCMGGEAFFSDFLRDFYCERRVGRNERKRTMQINDALRTLPQLLGLLAIMAVTQPQGRAQDTNRSNSPNHSRFDIEVKESKLLLAPLKDSEKIHQITGSGTSHAITATIENLGKYLSAADTNLNLVVSPEAELVTIQNLKLRGADIAEVMQAISYATQARVRGNPFSSSGQAWAITARPEPPPEQSVEVFNLKGFIDQHDRKNVKVLDLDKELAEIKKIILDTLLRLKQGHLEDKDTPSFSFHPGTGLFIVIGTPTAAEVTRKIVNALPGQPQPGSGQMIDLQLPKKEN